MKKRTAATISFALVLSLCSCGGSPAEVTETMAEAVETTAAAAAAATVTSAAATDTSAETTDTSAETTDTSAAATDTSAETTDTSAAATYTSAETEVSASDEGHYTFVSDAAQSCFNAIMADEGWLKDTTLGATLLDLDGNGTPEFIATDELEPGDENNSAKQTKKIYSVNSDSITYMYDLPIIANTLAKYDDNGTLRWWGNDSTFYQDENGYESSSTYSLYTFHADSFDAEEKFRNHEVMDKKTDLYTAESIIDGVLYGKDSIADYSKLDDMPDISYYGWFTKKADWEGAHLDNSQNYLLIPNGDFSNRTSETDVEKDIATLVNAFYSNDSDYLCQEAYFGEVNAFKPVLYLYPEEKTDVSVKLDLKGELTCTYPDYDGGWRVTAFPDGRIFNRNDGREYSYLFWEGGLEENWDMSSGFVIKGDDTAEFLREKLAYLGLTAKEYNEFIVYWLPLMQNNPYNLISFQQESYTEAAELKISPAPDTEIRVFMTFKALEKPLDIPVQQLTPTSRNGFTVVEWGGTEVK